MDLTDRFTPAAEVHDRLPIDWSQRWSRSGAACLSGDLSGSPLGVPSAMVALVDALGDRFSRLSAQIGRRVDVDGPALLGERAAIAGFGRRGTTSCGGASRLLPTASGWIALSLARESDWGLLPAWLNASFQTLGLNASFETLGLNGDVESLWQVIAAEVRPRDSAGLVDRAGLLGLPCSRLAEVTTESPLVTASVLAGESPARLGGELVVVDLSSLWAGPLCANLLGLAGARIIKVESRQRPDGARSGPSKFYDLLHAGHESVALDFSSRPDMGMLQRLLSRADVVIEASRPRALAHLGIDPARTARAVWLSITGYGREGPAGDRVAFGDDAAIAGGLATYDGDRPHFCVDAVTDPISGLLAATAVLDRLLAGQRWLVDIGLARTAAWCAGGALAHPSLSPAAPHHRPIVGTGPHLGEHTHAVISEFGLQR